MRSMSEKQKFNYTDNYTKQSGASGMEMHGAAEVAMPMDHHDMAGAVSDKKERWKFVGIIFVIAICATVMSGVLGFDPMEWMRWFMGSFFIIFGSFKLIGYEMFIMMFPTYDPIAKRFKAYNFGYPFIELGLGFMYAANLLPTFRDVFTFTIMSVGAWGVYKSIPKGETIRCACLGNIIKLPLSTVTLVEDVTMALMALVMLVASLIT